MIVAHRGIAAGLEKDNWQALINQRQQRTRSLFGLPASFFQKTFGDERPATADAGGNDDLPPSRCRQPARGNRYLRFIKISKRVGKNPPPTFFVAALLNHPRML